MRCITAVMTCAALLATGCSGPRQGEDAAPSVARVVCEAGGARAVTPIVRPVDDGISLLFDNRSGARAFYIRTADSPDQNHGGRLELSGTTEMMTTMPPGEVLIGCFERGADIQYYDVTPEFSRVTIVDPDDLWISPDLSCEQDELGEQERYVDGPAVGAIPDDVEEIVRAVVPNVLPTDQIVRPGYPGSQWHGEFRHVVRNRRAIASVTTYAQHGRWNAMVRACEGAVIG